MRTLLSQFCDSFDEVIRPLLSPLHESAEALLKAGPDLPGMAVRADLLDLQHQFEALVKKISEQQAYVLLFGPLKSGKSTLMNCIARSYVSEVSSLPAYPCMVFVSHGETRCFDVTRYSGRSERFTDPTALHLFINRAHSELADRIRIAEENGDTFDPALHYSEAIRRIDVRLPAEELAESGAVLVDTPGLYARMRFGYSQMTRDFRDAASCAIFVVKSDNLFLEQVFEEFEELLDLFSRIFLVVNLDSAKRDLAPDGRLIPSLEQEDPLRIIEAFENLAMSAPLKRAADEGRLRIYPIDLLRAASARLANDDEPEAIQGQIDFEAFQRDLTDYLNSTEYLVAFLGDSLRRAQALLDEAAQLLKHPEVGELEVSVAQLDEERQGITHQRQAVQRLDAQDWKVVFGELSQRLAPNIREQARMASAETERNLDAILARWFATPASFQALIEDDLVPALDRYQAELAGHVRTILGEEVASGTAGVLLTTDIAKDLYTAGIDVNAIGREVIALLTDTSTRRPIDLPLTTSQIPVKRGFFDWILLRPMERVRRNLFGQPSSPVLRIPVDVKQKRLGPDARAALVRQIDVFKSRFFHETLHHLQEQIVGAYTNAAIEALHDALARRDGELEVKGNELVRRLLERRRVLAHLSTLGERAEGAMAKIEELSLEYGATEPDLLIVPMELPGSKMPVIPQAGPLGGAILDPATSPWVVPEGRVEAPTDVEENIAAGDSD
ncbi:MAG TPA: hypothetical protein EYQ25_03530 [Planctomycetes bacterium]|nr:hypothetical protein [Planctomycetota bacterium]HIL36772.1 hypothetical protein [Planctomycetota bacterium]